MKENAKRQKQDLRDRERRARRVKVAIGTVVAVAVAAFALSSFTPAGGSSTEAITAAGGFRRITIDEFKAQHERGEVTVIDVRDVEAFLQSHIPGALHIPLARIEGEIDYLPQGKPIVTYCTCPAEESSGQAVQILEHRGITNATALQGGLQEWRRRGYPTTSGSS